MDVIFIFQAIIKTTYKDNVCVCVCSQYFHALILMIVHLCPLRPVTVMTMPRVRSSNRRKEKLHPAQSVDTRHRRPRTSACPVSHTKALVSVFVSSKSAVWRNLQQSQLPYRHGETVNVFEEINFISN